MRIPKYWIRKIIRFRDRVRRYRNSFKDIEVELYDMNIKLRPYFHFASVFLFICALASLIVLAGFNINETYSAYLDYLDIAIAVGYLLLYTLRLIFTSQRKLLVKDRILESILFVLLILIGVVYLIGESSLMQFFQYTLGIAKPYPALILFTKIYLVLFVIAKLLQAAPILISVRRHPAEMIVSSFFCIIIIGSLMLMLPKATVDGQTLPFIDALFTSTSAVCVTGLIVVDTATRFTVFGQVVIMALIQLGGMGIITFATLFALFLSNNLGVGQMTFLKDIVSEDKAHETFGTIKRIVGLTFFIEFLGMIGYYISWTNLLPDPSERLYFSMFHAVSAFCNAGFSLFTNNLADPQNMFNWGVNITTMLLIIIGGLGFTTIWELARGNPQRKARQRQYSVHTRLVLWSTAFLIVSGTIAFLVLEWNSTLSGLSGSHKLLVSMLQSVTTRTAGFNSVDIGSLQLSTTIIFLTLMAIGASPASTGGGIKTTTVSVLLLKVWATVRGKERVEFAKRTISPKTISIALTAFVLAAIFLFIFTFALTITESKPFTDLIFEEFSAFATVGLSRGITASLSNAGKIIVTLSMFIGRVGSVTMALAFATEVRSKKYQYPQESVIVA